MSDITHNIALDILRRAGLVGLLLIVAASIVLSVEVLITWRSSADNLVAALALGALAATSGLVAKGMVESVLEKDRLSALLAVTLGLMVSASIARFPTSSRGAQDLTPRSSVPSAVT